MKNVLNTVLDKLGLEKKGKKIKFDCINIPTKESLQNLIEKNFGKDVWYDLEDLYIQIHNDEWGYISEFVYYKGSNKKKMLVITY